MNSERPQVTGLTLRPMTAIDVPKCQRLSAELGWPHRLEDWAQMYRLAKGAVLETPTGEIVGTIFLSLQGNCATIGLLIVRASHQGLGLGRQLMQWAIDEAGGRPIALNATKAGLALYEKLGFKSVGTVRQYQGVLKATETSSTGHLGRPAASQDSEQLQALSFDATGFDRAAILEEVFSCSRRLCVLEQAGLIRAFGCLRPFGRGLHLGPLIAGDIQQAAVILHELLSDLEGEFVRMDCPLDSDLERLLTERGLAPASDVVQMVLGEPPAGTELRQFGLITQALG